MKQRIHYAHLDGRRCTCTIMPGDIILSVDPEESCVWNDIIIDPIAEESNGTALLQPYRRYDKHAVALSVISVPKGCLVMLLTDTGAIGWDWADYIKKA